MTAPKTLPNDLTINAPITDVILRLHELATPPVEWQRGADAWREQIDRTRPIEDDEVVRLRLRWSFYGIFFSIDTARVEGTLRKDNSDSRTHLQLSAPVFPPTFLYLTAVAMGIAALTAVVALLNGDFGNVVLALAPMVLLGLAAYGVRGGVQSAVAAQSHKLKLAALAVETQPAPKAEA